MDDNEYVIGFYDKYDEWSRIDRCVTEFAINRRFMDRYIKSGDSVLDIGSGPGRYALDLAAHGCHVSLIDISPNHIDLAKVKAQEMGVDICAVCGDACYADELVQG